VEGRRAVGGRGGPQAKASTVGGGRWTRAKEGRVGGTGGNSHLGGFGGRAKGREVRQCEGDKRKGGSWRGGELKRREKWGGGVGDGMPAALVEKVDKGAAGSRRTESGRETVHVAFECQDPQSTSNSLSREQSVGAGKKRGTKGLGGKVRFPKGGLVGKR